MMLIDKKDCTGCAACVSACPAKCMVMQEDAEGFLYPQIQAEACIKCGKCTRVCPVANQKEEMPFLQTGYIVQNKEEQILRESTAGGAFTAIARYVIEQGGVVFGAALTENLSVQHCCADHMEALAGIRGSKYVQSAIGNTFIQAKEYLDQGKPVCFSGTPCQIEGLMAFLGRDYENLITVDVVCRAVPSPLIYRKYLELQEAKFGEKITGIRFRDKAYGYKYSTMNLTTERNRGNYHEGVETDPWLRAFFSGMCLRPSCYDCRFKRRYRVSDFTIWDCFHVGRFSKELDNDKGATRILIHTEKGQKLFEVISGDFNCIAVPPEQIVDGTKEMFCSVSYNGKRTAFMQDARVLSGEQLFQKYFPVTMKVRAEHLIRLLCLRLGIYQIAKKVYVRLTHKY